VHSQQGIVAKAAIGVEAGRLVLTAGGSAANAYYRL